MGTKFIPTEEQIALIQDIWTKTGSYSEIAKHIEVSSNIIKRLVSENIKKENQDIPFEKLDYYGFYRLAQQLEGRYD